MSGSRWVITPLWLSGSWRSFLYSSSVYSCHFFLISLLLLGLYYFCPLLSPSLHEMFPWYLIFLKRFLVIPILLFSSISLHWSLKKSFLSFLLFFGTLRSDGYSFPFLLCLSLLFFSHFCKASSNNKFAFCISFFCLFFGEIVLITASCTMSWTSIHSFSVTLSIRSNPLNLFVIYTV